MEENEWDFKGIKRHTISQFPLIKDTRKESPEETLNLLKGEDSGGIFPRTTHIYKSDKEFLEDIHGIINVQSKFISSEIVHESSDLGLVYKIIAEHESGSKLFFDGLSIRVTSIVNDDDFNIEDLLSMTGYPKDEYNVIQDLITCIKELFPDESEYGHSIYSYYSIDETNWEKVGLKRKGDAQGRIVIQDPNYFTITAIIFMEMGKDFHVYFGEEDRIHQMIGQDFFIMQEIEMFSDYFNKKLKYITNFQNELKECFDGVLAPFWKVHIKKKKWNKIKEMLISLYSVMEITMRGKLLTKSIEKFIENRIAFFNGPRQIWLAGEEQDTEEKIQHQINHFFDFKIENSKLNLVSDTPIVPFYNWNLQNLNKILDKITNYSNDLYQKEKDLLNTYQTEFALDALIIAVIAIVISSISFINGNILAFLKQLNISGFIETIKLFLNSLF